MKKFWRFLSVGCCAVLVLSACDLQPRIMSLPDSVGDFISSRYPALLADPVTQSDIYNSAAADYGVYAAPELYGGVTAEDYLLYSDINDYMFPAQPAAAADTPSEAPKASSEMPETGDDMPVTDEESETLTIAEYSAVPDDVLVIPMYGGAQDSHVIAVAKGDTIYSIARRYGATASEVAEMNNIAAPYSIRVGQKLKVPGNGDVSAAPIVPAAPVAAPQVSQTTVAQTPAVPAVQPAAQSAPVRAATPAKVQLQSVTVQPGDTLYSISRRYSVPVNDLAVMNDLGAPFALTVGQKIKVPNLQAAAAEVKQTMPTKAVAVASAPVKTTVVATPKTTTKSASSASSVVPAKTQKTSLAPKAETPRAPVKQEKQKISSDPSKKLPAIAARSSSKFSWPVRGSILSGFGAKSNGLFNDGINIGAARGTAVKAAENGVVAYAGNEVKGMGNLIIIQHAGGWMTVYAHMDSMAVRRGARVNVGQKIGTVGATGKVDRPQLHFEIRKGTKAYNPSQYLKK